MKNYIYHIRLFIYRFLLLLGIFSISRILFYIFNLSYFSEINVFELIKISVAGIRFDISALFYFNILFIVLSLIPGNFKNHITYQRILYILFILINSILLSFNFVDTKFFDFEHKRLTADIFSGVWLGEDFRTLLPQFVKDYWYLILIWLSMVFLLVRFYAQLKPNKIDREKFKLKTIVYQSLIFILLVGLGVIGGRGGLQLKPLRVIHAAKYTKAQNVPLILNTPFTIMKTIGIKTFTPKQYFSKEELDSIYSPVIKPNKSSIKQSPNIVIIILESFSREYIGAFNNGKGYTPFLDSLIDNSLVFTKAFANGKRSIEAVPSIITSLPALTDEPFISSKFASNKINSISNLLRTKGYYSAFFHGGKNGTMGFDQFAYVAGYNDYFGKNEYPNKADDDGNWGIYDEPYLQYFGNKLTEFKQPFFATIFTLTSHHPYEIPEKYKDKFPKGTLNIHQSIGYTDYSLKKFFESIKNTDWYKNTLFILVADHTAQAESPYYNNKLGNYAIPIIFYNPTDSTLRGKADIIAQQADIFPSIMDYIGYDQKFICFGNSLFNHSQNHFSVDYINGIYQIIEDDYLLQFDGTKAVAFFNIKQDSLLQHNLVNKSNVMFKYENKLKAIIQAYQERLVSNHLTIN